MQTYIYMWPGSKRKKETGESFVVTGNYLFHEFHATVKNLSISWYRFTYHHGSVNTLINWSYYLNR
jgi:hypothetical protein